MSFANENSNKSLLNLNAKVKEVRHFFYQFRQKYTERRNLIKMQLSKYSDLTLIPKTELINELELVNKLLAIDEELYTKVLNEYNASKIDMLIHQNINFKISDEVGMLTILVRQFRPDAKRIDWFSSQRVRDAIIKAGRVPYNKDKNPDGEKFHVYYTSTEEPFFLWVKPKKTNPKAAENIQMYKFKPSVRTACTKLFNFRNANLLNISLYRGNKNVLNYDKQ